MNFGRSRTNLRLVPSYYLRLIRKKFTNFAFCVEIVFFGA